VEDGVTSWSCCCLAAALAVSLAVSFLALPPPLAWGLGWWEESFSGEGVVLWPGRPGAET